LGWMERARLQRDLRLRPFLQNVCAIAGCSLPRMSDLEKLTLLDRDVKPHPRAKTALLISASVRNDASFTQDFPMLEVRLLNVTRQTIAARRFVPEEYLLDTSVLADGFAPGSNLPIVFEVQDPGSDAINFEFAFLPYTPVSPE
jgi:hypothetical protein